MIPLSRERGRMRPGAIVRMVDRRSMFGMLARRTALVAILGAPWLACVPSGLGGTCRFEGDDSSPCGQCIAKSCQQPVNECCASEACTQSLEVLDRCATGSSCGTISAVSSALASCIASSCPVCSTTDGGAGRADGASNPDAAPRFSSDCGDLGKHGCICSAGGAGDDTECSTASTNGGFCCADRGWPEGDGTLCSCAPFTCEPVTGNAFVDVRCRLEDLHTGITEATGSKCCIDVFLEECKCGPSDMGCDPENVVPRCTVDVMRCISSRSIVDSCSF